MNGYLLTYSRLKGRQQISGLCRQPFTQALLLPVQLAAATDGVGDGHNVIIARQKHQHGSLRLCGVNLDDELRHQSDVHLVIIKALLIHRQQLPVLRGHKMKVFRSLLLRYVGLQSGSGAEG